MVRGKGTTELFDKRINIRVSSKDWQNIMLQAQKERQKPSAWLRVKICKLLKRR